MTYASKSDIADEFKDIVFTSTTPVTPANVIKFLQEADAVINSYLSQRYATPITGIASVKQKDSITVSAALAATTYTATINGQDVSYLSGGAPTLQDIRDGLIAAINALSEALALATTATDTFTITSQVAGEPFTISVGANLSTASITANVKGDERLDIVRKIETDLVACRIAKILKLKVNSDEFTKQESTHCEAANDSLELLKDYSSGKIALPGADLTSSGAGFADYNNANNVEPVVNKDIDQW